MVHWKVDFRSKTARSQEAEAAAAVRFTWAGHGVNIREWFSLLRTWITLFCPKDGATGVKSQTTG